MTNPVFRLPARPQPLEISYCTRGLMGTMQRFVIDRDVGALREFHRMGIPLDYALDYAVKKGCMPLIEELMNNLGVVPSDSTLVYAVRRGVAIRNMFLKTVTATVNHLNSAVASENFDVANVLLGRVKPNFQTVLVLKPCAKQTQDRRLFIGRLASELSEGDLRNWGILRRMAGWTSIAQFECAVDRLGQLTQQELDTLLCDCLITAAPGHARAMIHRGAIFGREHLRLAGHGRSYASDSNPRGMFSPVLRAVLETAIDQKTLFEEIDEVRGVVEIIAQAAFEAPAPFTEYCEFLARCCKPEIRLRVGGLIVAEAATKQRVDRGRWTMEDLNLLSDQIDSLFSADDAIDLTCGDAPGAAP